MICTQRNVLVVDDNKAICELLKVALSEKGFSVATASNGLEALNKIQESTPSVVLLDLKLPKIPGIEVLNKLTDMYPSLPVIIITAYENQKDIIRAKERGEVKYYLTKPFSLYELYEILNSLEGTYPRVV